MTIRQNFRDFGRWVDARVGIDVPDDGNSLNGREVLVTADLSHRIGAATLIAEAEALLEFAASDS